MGIKEDLSNLADNIQAQTDVNQAKKSLERPILDTLEKRVPAMTTSRHTNLG